MKPVYKLQRAEPKDANELSAVQKLMGDESWITRFVH